MDPKRLFERTFGNRRLAAVLVAFWLAYGLGALAVPLVRMHHGVVRADAYTYVTFARNLASGHYYLHGPVAEAAAAFHAPDEGLVPGPVWNTNTDAEGRTLFTVAIGYPLFLSVFIKLLGVVAGLKVNLLLVALVFVLFGLCLWEGLGRTLESGLVAALACLILARTHPLTLHQFTLPWREPLFYSCVLGGVYALLRFRRGGGIKAVAVAAILLGYAVSVKEPNAIYAFVLGVGLVCSRAFRQHPRRVAVLGVFVAGGIVGGLPLLVQNTMSLGNPLKSMQLLRATQSEAIDPGHVASTLGRYVGFYQRLPWFSVPVLVLAAVGLVIAVRRGWLGRVLAGMLAVHLGLYLQWGNADFRHMYFAHIPHAFFVSMAVVVALHEGTRRLRGAAVYAPWVAMAPLVVLSLWPIPPAWRPPARPERDPFRGRDIAAFRAAMEGLSDQPAVLLSNRDLRDLAAAYTDHAAIRAHDLRTIHPAHDLGAVVDWLLAQGHRVLFLDNDDLDPRNAGLRAWATQDEQALMDHFDLVPVGEFSSDALNLHGLVKKPVVRALAVGAWTRTRVVKTFPPTAEEDAAFLLVRARSSGEALRVTLNGDAVKGSDPDWLRNVTGISTRRGAEVALEAGGAPIGAHDDVVLYGWHDPIRLECGAYAVPPDAPLWPEGVDGQPDALYREFFGAFTIRVPVRQTVDSFTTIGLAMNAMGTATGHVNMTVQPVGQRKALVKHAGAASWFPVHVEASGPWAGMVDVTYRSEPPLRLKVNRVKSFSSRQRLRYEPGPGAHGVVFRGYITPRAYGEGMHDWSLQVNGARAAQGACYDDPRREVNEIVLQLTDGDIESAYELGLTDAGVIKPEWLEIGSSLHLEPGGAWDVMVKESMFRSEEGQGGTFAWTRESFVFAVPVGPAGTSYRLTLAAEDGIPSGSRTATLRGEGMRDVSIDLPATREEREIVVRLPGVANPGMTTLTLSVDPWVPKDMLVGTRDKRRLGFRLFSLRWDPLPAEEGL